MDTTEIHVTLRDTYGQEDIKVSVYFRDYGIAIKPHGYSCKDGGEPIMVYNKNGNVQVLVWPDINKNNFDEHLIEGARDGKRKKGCDIAGVDSGGTSTSVTDFQAEIDGV
jgi:hypothetical protein